MKFIDFSSKDIGIDLGTTNVLISVKGKGIVLNEPSLIAIDQSTKQIIATGQSSIERQHEMPETVILSHPILQGAIANYVGTGMMVKNMIKSVCKKYNMGKPTILIATPSKITEVQTRAIQETFLNSGAKEVYLVDAPIAALIGASQNVLRPRGKMIVDIGGGKIDIAVVSLGQIINSRCLKFGGDDIDKQIVESLKNRLEIGIDIETARNLKCILGSAMPLISTKNERIRVKNIRTGAIQNISISSKDIYIAMEKVIEIIIETIIDILSEIEPQMSQDILENGIILSGGGSGILNLDNLIVQRTGIKTIIAKNPMENVINGLSKILSNMDKYKDTIKKGI